MTAKLHDWRRVEIVEQFDPKPNAILPLVVVGRLVPIIVDCRVLVFGLYETRNDRWKQQTQQNLTVVILLVYCSESTNIPCPDREDSADPVAPLGGGLGDRPG